MRTRSLLLAGTLALFAISAAHAGKVGSDCTYKGKKLYGKIQIVNSFPDIKIRYVTSFPGRVK
jgi:catabolite regulation protein CreA